MTATTKAGKGMSTQLTRGRPSTAGARRGGVVEARRGPNGPEPTHFREAFRQAGPSVETNATSTPEAAHA